MEQVSSLGKCRGWGLSRMRRGNRASTSGNTGRCLLRARRAGAGAVTPSQSLCRRKPRSGFSHQARRGSLNRSGYDGSTGVYAVHLRSPPTPRGRAPSPFGLLLRINQTAAPARSSLASMNRFPFSILKFLRLYVTSPLTMTKINKIHSLMGFKIGKTERPVEKTMHAPFEGSGLKVGKPRAAVVFTPGGTWAPLHPDFTLHTCYRQAARTPWLGRPGVSQDVWISGSGNRALGSVSRQAGCRPS